MSSKKEAPPKSLCDIARRSGPYPEAAYHFVREGLEYAAQAVHGPLTPEQHMLAQYMAAEKIDFEGVLERQARGELDSAVAAAIDRAGGPDKVNRNVSGEDLCWGLRDFAIRRWGGLTGMVLEHWHIRATEDFGRIVFAMVKHGVMQKESHDSIEHFKGVFDFAEVFDRSFRFFDADRREPDD